MNPLIKKYFEGKGLLYIGLILSLGMLTAWIFRNELSSFLLGGRSFAGRSLLVQFAFVGILSLFFGLIFMIVFFTVRFLFHRHIELINIRVNLALHDLKSIYLPRIFSFPIFFWIFTTFLMAYFFFFIMPVFLNPEQSMKFIQYLPGMNPIGGDIRQILNFSASWFEKSLFMYGNVYPPLFTLLIFPFTKINPGKVYTALTIINILSYLSISFVLPVLITKKRHDFSVPLLFCLTGLFSYGFHFELERGQFNIIAFNLVLIALYIFYYKPTKLRYLAYILFSLAIQIKIYPAIFVFLFIDNWRNWKRNINFLVTIGIFNLALLFSLGYQAFLNFLNALINIRFGYVWIGNHSIKSFVSLLQQGVFQPIFNQIEPRDFSTWIARYWMFVQYGLMILVVLCFITTVLVAYKRNVHGFNANLFMIGTLTALLLPSISHDYTLSLLVCPMVVYFEVIQPPQNKFELRFLYILLVIIAVFAYVSTLFSYTNKPLLFQNSLPALMIMLVCFTRLYILSNCSSESETVQV